MTTITYPVAHVTVPCVRVDYNLPTDDAAAIKAAIETAIVTKLQWTKIDTVNNQLVFKKVFGGVERFVGVDVDYSGAVEHLHINQYSGWDGTNHTPVHGSSDLTHHVALGAGQYKFAFFVYEHPRANMYLQISNRP